MWVGANQFLLIFCSKYELCLFDRSQSYVQLDEEFAVSDADWKWLISHTEYTEQELQSMLFGFREEYPGGGIYRHQFEQMTGNTVMNVIFK